MTDERLLADMGKFSEERVKAGVMVAGEGLHPSSKGARVRFSRTARTVIDDPFAEAKELVAGFWLWKVKDLNEAIEWVKRSQSDERRIRNRNPRGLRSRGFRRRVHTGVTRPRGTLARKWRQSSADQRSSVHPSE